MSLYENVRLGYVSLPSLWFGHLYGALYHRLPSPIFKISENFASVPFCFHFTVAPSTFQSNVHSFPLSFGLMPVTISSLCAAI